MGRSRFLDASSCGIAIVSYADKENALERCKRTSCKDKTGQLQ